MKRIYPVIIILLSLVLVLCSCGDQSGQSEVTTVCDTNAVTTDEVTTVLSEDTTSGTDETSDETTTAEATTEETTVAEVKANPVITLASSDTLTVKAGESVDLPAMSAVDYDQSDLAASVKIRDSVESGTINGGKFSAKFAGEHTVYYSVDTDDGRFGEAFLTVNVTPCRENTFDDKDENYVENMAAYKEFRESFEKGRRSALITDFDDMAGACYISACEEAISGNSLVIDVDKIGGATQTALFFRCFANQFKTGIQATYKVSFDYKVIVADSSTGDIYFGLKWDGMDGMNRKIVASDAKLGQVYRFEAEFSAATVPAGVNPAFFIFQLNKAAAPIKIAIDNVVIETLEVEQIANQIPTAKQMSADGGYTWDFTDTTATCGSGQIVAVSALDESVKNAMTGNDAFSEKVLKLTGIDDHKFDGLTSDNLVTGKRLILEMDYYAINDGGFYLIMMGRTGNPTQTVEVTDNGAFKHVKLDTVILDGWYQLNIYGHNNANFEIYVGNINVYLTEREDDGKTPSGHEPGFTFSQNSRAFGNTEKSGWICGDYDGYNFGGDAEKMGESPAKFTFANVSDVTMEWFRADSRIEAEYKYKITVTYYVDSFNGSKMMYNFDNQTFLEIGSGDYLSQGFHRESIEWTADRTVDFVSFYLDGSNSNNGVIYVQGITVELLGKG